MAYKHRLDLTMGMPKGMNRMDQFPLDMSSVYYSYNAMETYAKTSAIAYVGQPLSLVDEENGVVTLYTIQDTAGTLKKVGSATIGDGSTITVAENGTVSLYGIAGLPFEKTNDQGETVKINYQPLLVDGKLTWVEPSATTVEGLATEIEGLKTRTSAVEAIAANIGEVAEGKTIVEMIADAQTAATYDDTELQAKVTANTNILTTLTGDTTVEGSIDKKINDTINDFITKVTDNGTIDTFKELVDYIEEHGDDASKMLSAIETLETKVGEKSVLAQIQEAIEAENLSQYATDEDLVGVVERIETLEGIKHHDHDNKALLDTYTQTEANLADAVAKKHEHENSTVLDSITSDKVEAWDAAEKNVISSVDSELAIDEDRKLSIIGIAQDKITGLTNVAGNDISLAEALDSKVSKNGTDRLITEAEAAKLELLVIDEETGQAAISGTVNANQVQGLSDLLDGKVDKVEGMGLSANNFTDSLLEKLNGIEAGAQVNDIELIKIAGSESALEITNKTVEIPFAGIKNAGVVKVSAEVGLDDNNALEIKSVNANKLVQNEGEFLVLNGGSATA